MMNTKRNQFWITTKRGHMICSMIIFLIVAGCNDPVETTEEAVG